MTRQRHKPEDLSLPQQRYIEAIAELAGNGGHARMTDVASRLNVTLPSASEAVKRLGRLGLVARKSRFEIRLTRSGQEIGSQLTNRHEALRTFMTDIMGLSAGTADRTACQVEHCVDRQFTDRLMQLADFLKWPHPDALRGYGQRKRKGHRGAREAAAKAPGRQAARRNGHG